MTRESMLISVVGIDPVLSYEAVIKQNVLTLAS